jgi:tRNA dimethylallyltransferase
MNSFTQFALIGPTASGKTALSIKLAQQYNAHILSLDSLSIYKEIDIVSAKPTPEERAGIIHFGIDHLYPDAHFDVTTFIHLYRDVHARCLHEEKNLIIVGGTGFYLKALLEGISELPPIDHDIALQIAEKMQDTADAHAQLHQIDPEYMEKISTNDSYRIQKVWEIYLAAKEPPSKYFETHPPKPVITEPLPLYEIVWERSLLRERIAQRTAAMLQEGLIDEVCMLEARYTRAPHCMKAIGIKETLDYLDGRYDQTTLQEKISTNTARLAKRQSTFNRSQFQDVTRGSLEQLEALLLKS